MTESTNNSSDILFFNDMPNTPKLSYSNTKYPQSSQIVTWKIIPEFLLAYYTTRISGNKGIKCNIRYFRILI